MARAVSDWRAALNVWQRTQAKKAGTLKVPASCLGIGAGCAPSLWCHCAASAFCFSTASSPMARPMPRLVSFVER